MILAKNRDAGQYLGLNANLDAALRRILSGLDGLESGHYDMDGDNVWLNCFDYDTIPESEAFYEAHEHYGDIHIMLEGSEKVCISHPDMLTEFERTGKRLHRLSRRGGAYAPACARQLSGGVSRRRPQNQNAGGRSGACPQGSV